MFSSKLYLSLRLFIILFSLLFLFLKTYHLSENYTYSHETGFGNVENCSNSFKPLAEKIQNDPALNLLGENFSKIKDVFGEPAEEGSSNRYGPHNYMSYKFNEGIVRFNSPQGLENNITVSIILSEKQKILCTRVGMSFSEIKNVLGDPSRGPEQGKNGLYYMEYFLGNVNNRTPEIVISFAAEKIDGPTVDAFIKWEAFDYEKVDNLMDFQIVRR